MKKNKIIIALPAYKAEKTLAKTLYDIPKNIADEILLVDDASPDDTVKVAKELGLKIKSHSKNKGYGGNQKTCYNTAIKMEADIVVLLHPDYQYDPKIIPALIEPIENDQADFTFGSRFINSGDPLKGGMPYYRYLGNKFTTKIENLLLGTNFSELHSGLKAYNRNFLKAIPYQSYSNDFVFDSQMLIDAVLNNFKITEVPIPTRYTNDSSSASLGDCIKYVGQTFSEIIKRKYLRRKD